MIQSQVGELLYPVYDRIGKVVPFILLIILLIFIKKIITKIKEKRQGKRNSSLEATSTNKWFSWDDFYKSKERMKVSKSDVPQTKDKSQFNKEDCPD